jgi:hypothetical protein
LIYKGIVECVKFSRILREFHASVKKLLTMRFYPGALASSRRVSCRQTSFQPDEETFLEPCRSRREQAQISPDTSVAFRCKFAGRVPSRGTSRSQQISQNPPNQIVGVR